MCFFFFKYKLKFSLQTIGEYFSLQRHLETSIILNSIIK